MGKATPVGVKIVTRIAGREGVDPVDLDDLLYDAIDADALHTFVDRAGDRRSRSNRRVEFTYHGYAVSVDGTGTVTIDDRPPAADTDESARDGTVDD